MKLGYLKTVNINLGIKGNCCEHNHENKSKITRKGRYNGGIYFYYKTKFKTKYIKAVEKQQKGIDWIVLGLTAL